MASKYLNLSTDDTLGGNTPSDYLAVSQKAIKTYVDNNSGGGGSVDIDNNSITKNTSDELQTIGVINQNNTTIAIKTWTGTKAQYDAIVTKDSNTLYNIIDDTDVTLPLLELLYPVGSIYIGTMATCPLQVLGVGNWQLIASDRVLQSSGTNTVGSLVEAGLPNITGSINSTVSWASNTPDTNSAISASKEGGCSISNGSSESRQTINFNASNSNSIYGNSTTVQPPAYIVNIWERIS